MRRTPHHWRSEGVLGVQPHRAALARGGKRAKIVFFNSDCNFMCLRAIKTKHYSCSAYLSSVSWAIILGLWLSSFQNLRRKGGIFDHRPERPKVLLRHCSTGVSLAVSGVHDSSLDCWRGAQITATCSVIRSTIRYDTRCYFNMSRLNLPHGDDN